MDQQEIPWRQYSQTVELYKFYMDLMVKFNVFYYAVTGAILSFFFANPDIDDIEFALAASDHERCVRCVLCLWRNNYETATPRGV